MPFQRVEFILGHDDIYQKFYWYLLLSDGFQLDDFLEESERMKGNKSFHNIFKSNFPIEQTFYCPYKHTHSLF